MEPETNPLKGGRGAKGRGKGGRRNANPKGGNPKGGNKGGTPGGKPSGEDDVAQPRVKNTVQEAKKVFGLHSTVGNRAVLLQELDDN